MNIEDFDIKIKKYDRENNFVIVNLVILKEFEIRGYVARFTKTKYSDSPIWLVSPPTKFIGKGKYKKAFWIAELKNTTLRLISLILSVISIFILFGLFVKDKYIKIN